MKVPPRQGRKMYLDIVYGVKGQIRLQGTLLDYFFLIYNGDRYWDVDFPTTQKLEEYRLLREAKKAKTDANQ